MAKVYEHRFINGELVNTGELMTNYVDSSVVERKAMTKKGTQYVVLGLSGAGKDTVAKLLRMALCSVVNVKWSDMMKRTFADWYGVDYEQFNDQQRRYDRVPGTGITYLEVMVRAYHAWDMVDPLLTIRPTARKAEELLEQGCRVVYTDTRKMAEADAIAALACKYETHLIYVHGREGEVRRSTDELLQAIIYRLGLVPSVIIHDIVNDGEEGELIDKLLESGVM